MDTKLVAGRHPSVVGFARWFSFDHLPDGTARRISRMCTHLAEDVLATLPADDPELTAGLRKLLEAKDSFVRAAIDLDAS